MTLWADLSSGLWPPSNYQYLQLCPRTFYRQQGLLCVMGGVGKLMPLGATLVNDECELLDTSPSYLLPAVTGSQRSTLGLTYRCPR